MLTEIVVTSTLKAKLGRDFRPHTILGASNPQLAHQALEAELGVGLLLPCNVCIWAEEGGSAVSMVRPVAMFEIVRRSELQSVADEAGTRLRLAWSKSHRAE